MSSYLNKETKQKAIEMLANGESLDDLHLLALAHEMALGFYAMHGHQVYDRSHDFANSQHPQERLMWALSLYAVGFMRNCDIFDEYIDGVENE